MPRRKPTIKNKTAVSGKRAKQTIKQVEITQNRIEERIESSKYSTPEQPSVRTVQQYPKKHDDMPFNYGHDMIVLLVRDPRWVHAYWEITEAKYHDARKIIGADIGSSRQVLRVYETTASPWSSFDIEIDDRSRNWYINVPKPAGTYVADIGYRTADGRFILLARSNAVTTPREGMSDVIDEEWMTIDFERMYALSGGFGFGKSSGEIKELIKKHIWEMRVSGSGWISSPSSHSALKIKK